MTGMLFVSDGAHRVIIRDLSLNGARLRVEQPVQAGSDAVLKRKPLFAAGRIAWCRRGEVGLEFYRPLSLEELDFSFSIEG